MSTSSAELKHVAEITPEEKLGVDFKLFSDFSDFLKSGYDSSTNEEESHENREIASYTYAMGMMLELRDKHKLISQTGSVTDSLEINNYKSAQIEKLIHVAKTSAEILKTGALSGIEMDTARRKLYISLQSKEMEESQKLLVDTLVWALNLHELMIKFKKELENECRKILLDNQEGIKLARTLCDENKFSEASLEIEKIAQAIISHIEIYENSILKFYGVIKDNLGSYTLQSEFVIDHSKTVLEIFQEMQEKNSDGNFVKNRLKMIENCIAKTGKLHFFSGADLDKDDVKADTATSDTTDVAKSNKFDDVATGKIVGAGAASASSAAQPSLDKLVARSENEIDKDKGVSKSSLSLL